MIFRTILPIQLVSICIFHRQRSSLFFPPYSSFFFFLIRGYSEKNSRGIEFEEYKDRMVSHNVRWDSSLDLKSYLFREVAHFVLSQQGPVAVPVVSKLLQHPIVTPSIRVGGKLAAGCENSDAGNWQIRSSYPRMSSFSTLSPLEIRRTAPSRDRRICHCKYHHPYDVSRSIILSSKSYFSHRRLNLILLKNNELIL